MKPKYEMKYYYRFLCGAIYTIVATTFFAFTWLMFVTVHNQTNHLLGYGNLGMAIIIYIILYIYFGYQFRAFKIGVERMASSIASQVITLFTVNVFEILISMAITGQFRFFSAFAVRYFLLFLVQAFVNGLLTIPMVNIYRRVFPPLKLLEIYGDYKNNLTEKIDSLEYKYHISKRVHYKDADVERLLDGFDAVLINDIPAKQKNKVLKSCFANDKRVYYVPKISDIIVKMSSELNVIDTPLYYCRNNGISFTDIIIKRVFDFICSAIALVILSPLFGVIAIAIKLEDGGPVFFKQKRCTIGGKEFTIIKFRSMIVDAEKDGSPRPVGKNDDRITRVGKVIRATRMDELPQLINIIKGEMSIVGPRPERIEHVEKYTREIPEFRYRNKVKGGLTGYAQVYGKYNTTALDKLKLDLVYIMNFSLLLDIHIIFETIKILFMKESTEGFSEERSLEIHDGFKGSAKD